MVHDLIDLQDLEQRLASQPAELLVQELIATYQRLNAVSEELRAADAERLALRRQIQEKQVAEADSASSSPDLLHGMREGLLVFDLDGNILEMNPPALRLHGYQDVAEVRRHLYDFTPGFELWDLEGRRLDPDDWPMRRVLRGERVADLEVRVRHVRGEDARVWSYSGGLLYDPDGKPLYGILTIRDVTAQKLDEADRERILTQNREQREFLEELLRAVPLAIGVVSGPDHRFVLANAEHYAVPGRPAVEVVGNTLAEVFPELAPAVARAIDKVYRSGQAVHIREYPAVVEPDGPERYWNTDYIPLRDADGSVERVLILIREVTDEVVTRRQIEELAAQAQQQAAELDAVFEAMVEAVIVFDAGGALVTVNRAAREGYGLEQDGSSLADIVRRTNARHSDGRPIRLEEMAAFQALKGRAAYGTPMLLIDADGQERSVVASAAALPQEGGGLRGAVVVWHDVSEQAQTLAALAAERARLEAVIENAPEGIVLADAKGRVILSNPAADRVYVRHVPFGGATSDESQIKICHPDGRIWESREQPLTRSALHGETWTEVEQLIVLPGGQRRSLLSNTAPIRDALGRLTGAVGVFQDVTEQVAARETLRRRNEELQALTAELEAYDYTVAHDLKNPLSMIVGSADLLLGVLGDMEGEGPRRMLRNILEGTRRMRDIVDSLLLLANTRSDEVRIEPLDMAAILAQVRGSFEAEIARRGAKLRLAEDWPRALGYAPWIESVWTNYVSNALKYGGEPPCLELGFDVPEPGPDAVQPERAMVRFWIRDRGQGLTEEEQARLFVPFSRLDRPEKLGHGLGLALVRRIVEKLGGNVGVESRPGEGSTFWFTLPRT